MFIGFEQILAGAQSLLYLVIYLFCLAIQYCIALIFFLLWKENRKPAIVAGIAYGIITMPCLLISGICLFEQMQFLKLGIYPGVLANVCNCLMAGFALPFYVSLHSNNKRVHRWSRWLGGIVFASLAIVLVLHIFVGFI